MNQPTTTADSSRGAWTRAKALLSPGEGPPLRAIAEYGGWYPLVVITSLNVVDELDRAVLGVFGPNVQEYFGMNDQTFGLLVGVQVTALVLLAVPIGYLGTKVDRGRILRWSAAAWSLMSFATTFAIKLPLFFLARFGVGIGKSGVEPVGKSLLTDYYPPNSWNRILAIHGAANPVGGMLGPALAFGIAAFAGNGPDVWRWAFPVLTVPSVIALIASRRLKEPENQMVRGLAGSMLTVTGVPSGMNFREAAKRLLTITTFRRQILGIGILGFGLVGVVAFLNIFLEREYAIDASGRAIIGMILASASLLGTLVGGNVGERIFNQSPPRAVRMVGLAIAVFSVLLSFAVFLPSVWWFVPAAWIGLLCLQVGIAPFYTALSAISPPRLRPLMFSLLGLMVAVMGGIAGGVIVGTIAEAYDIRWGLAAMGPTGIVGGLLMTRGAATIEGDIAKVAAESEGDPLAAFM
ncbi:MAG TPA: MFS transporter [Ilumatobacteraceae bacterium]|nr:MFS transporter [Ilumatobacteraceae bacterium]